MNPSLELQVRQKISQLSKIAVEKYGMKYFLIPEIKFTKKGTAAGTAYITKNVINFNPVLLQENPEQFIKQTVTHEFAHILAYRVFDDRGHGKDWKRVMVQLGAEPKRCHNYDVSSVQRRTARIEYSCGCATYEISAKRHTMILNGKRYSCKKCKQVIKMVVDN